MNQSLVDQPKRSLPLVSPLSSRPPSPAAEELDIDAQLRVFEEEERARLGLGARDDKTHWVDTMTAPKVRGHERAGLTILVSGLTAAQDFLVEGALKGRGYNVHYFGMADQDGLRVGKEFGNRGQCNPTYFTVGNLVKHLIDLRDKEGMATEDILKNYVFLTAGACGPCRFGMYVTEYRKALRDAGFDGFRVMLFQQTGGLSQASGDDLGIEFNPPFFIGILKALVSGDVLNALSYRIRPYEIEAGATDRAMERAKRIAYDALQNNTNIFRALFRARREFAAVKVDKLRPKAKVCILGEFWAMTTEGDGNHALQRFLESEGGENDIQIVTNVLLYNIWEFSRDTRERQDLKGTDGGQYGLSGLDEFGIAKRLAAMRLADLGLRGAFKAFAFPTGLYDYPLPDMDRIAELAHKHYHNDLRGGEGHMEVGKFVLNVLKAKANLTLSVKPFGCMPSSGVSDGVQSLVGARYPGALFCAVETNGDGATNFYSRVQMYMFKARQAAQLDLDEAYRITGLTVDDVRAFLAKHPRYSSPLHHPPHRVACSAANLVYEVAPLIQLSRSQRVARTTRTFARQFRGVAQAAPAASARVWNRVTDPTTYERLREDGHVVADLLRGRAQERFGPLVQRLARTSLRSTETSPPPVAVTASIPQAAE